MQLESNKMGKQVPVGEVVGIIQRSSQDMVVSMADEDQKALQSRQLTTRSVRLHLAVHTENLSLLSRQ